MATGGPLDSDGEQDPRIRADLDKEIQAAEETVQALRHSLLKAELRLKALRQRRNGGGASHPAESQRCTAPKEGLSSKLVGFGQLKGLGDWLAQQSNSLLQQAEAAGEQEAQLRTRRRQQLERQSEEQLQRDADAESERVVRQHALDFLDQTKDDGPPLDVQNASDVNKLFFQWLRDFHSEYDDAWFEQNLMRIDLAFRHIFEAALRDWRPATSGVGPRSTKRSGVGVERVRVACRARSSGPGWSPGTFVLNLGKCRNRTLHDFSWCVAKGSR
ncbi:unnamed protein product [Durusdinium trenchii]|uniref:Uncharacterized protein n=1 Tax=Durusdinium trenchii TaxID=1381693 RepID=A0ABP0QN20_9DINO